MTDFSKGSKAWHIKKKFLARPKIAYTPQAYPEGKMLRIELPIDYSLTFEEPSGKKHAYSSSCAIDLDPAFLAQDGKILLTIEKKACLLTASLEKSMLIEP